MSHCGLNIGALLRGLYSRSGRIEGDSLDEGEYVQPKFTKTIEQCNEYHRQKVLLAEKNTDTYYRRGMRQRNKVGSIDQCYDDAGPVVRNTNSSPGTPRPPIHELILSHNSPRRTDSHDVDHTVFNESLRVLVNWLSRPGTLPLRVLRVAESGLEDSHLTGLLQGIMSSPRLRCIEELDISRSVGVSAFGAKMFVLGLEHAANAGSPLKLTNSLKNLFLYPPTESETGSENFKKEIVDLRDYCNCQRKIDLGNSDSTYLLWTVPFCEDENARVLDEKTKRVVIGTKE